MEECKDIMVIDWATRIPTDAEEEYLSHLFCLGGGCWYRFNGMDFELHAGDLSIIRKRKMIENIEVSMDFCAKIIYVKSGFVELCNLRAIMEWKDNWPFPQLCHAPLAWTADCLSSRSWTAWVCVSRILNIVSTVKCLSTPCRRLSLIFSIFMLVSMMKATFQRRCLHHTSFLENAGGWYIPRTQGGILLCRLFVHYVEILVGSVKKGEQICRQLLD